MSEILNTGEEPRKPLPDVICGNIVELEAHDVPPGYRRYNGQYGGFVYVKEGAEPKQELLNDLALANLGVEILDDRREEIQFGEDKVPIVRDGHAILVNKTNLRSGKIHEGTVNYALSRSDQYELVSGTLRTPDKLVRKLL